MKLDEIAIMRHEIAIIPSYNIDSVKWNRCVNSSSNCLVYANSWYLDHTADNWSGIVMEDYKQVMPVAWRKKYGIRYSYQVPFIQQLGVYGTGTRAHKQLFVDALKNFCQYGDYPFNYANFAGEPEAQANFVLHLDRPYETVASNFSNDTTRNIRRAEMQELVYDKGDAAEAINCFQDLYSHIGVSSTQYDRFRQLCNFLAENDKLAVRKVVSKEGSLMATAILIRHQTRMYNVMNSTLPEGKKRAANYYLLSQIWQEFELSGLTFDFEGSDLAGVRDFYKKFGGTNEPYVKLHFNHLPWPIRLFKK